MIQSFDKSNLTPRELEIAACLLAGGTNRTIGQLLGISGRTVEVHRVRIMNKLGATSPVQLGVVATLQGIAPDARINDLRP